MNESEMDGLNAKTMDEIDRVLNDMRDEATRQLRAAGLPESASVRAWYQRFHGPDGEFNPSCYSVQIVSGKAFHYGNNKPTPDEAIAEVIAWWKADQEQRRRMALLAEFAEWKRNRAVAEVSK